ncbi:mono-functional DNA-alkylating methyl methanesulfonate N-term-domain-containing protein [Podospora aff. communis PSN243]|uniref:Mono-functional DNA-alkylating methyl methanesulfonate N-term-domain-containing protein n=1 Tax=Podospora aff. communis PSN243 TaxID=3040156 RepID=A0AAV9GQP6_9PEZI|nr:mono-functional DNA-alkylating methyl methanesulfonate N-term-domain-containing protein [Podospora aff. communis PSN243]
MAAFQTNVFRGGEWVTETVTLQAVLKAGTNAPGPKKQRLQKAPQCGVLTRTVVESPLVTSILPVRLRSPRHNDVAFIGTHNVRICELRRDGQLKEVARRSDFGSRIRNACVVGNFDIKEADDEAPGPTPIKTDDGSPEPFDVQSSLSAEPASRLPPQLLMLVLECGDSIFMFMERGSDGRFVFVTTRCPSAREPLVYPGFHLAIDPSSRYMVLACAQEFFVVYELESLDNLGAQYLRKERLVPVKSQRPRVVQGVIHKVHFLYPRPGDDRHVILLLIVVRHGRSRMITYEWELGDDLTTVFAEEKHGHRMPVENQMPVLIIPLTVRSAFIAISPDQVAVCTEGLYGPPNFETIEMHNPPATPYFHGRHQPLWTAWARPFRLSPYFEGRDCIYLAREDGVVIFIEADSESALDRSTFMDTFDSNISSAFTCLFDQYTDVLMLGSDSGPGAIWKVPARQPLELLGTLPNWSPSVDFVTTDAFSTWNQAVGANGERLVPWQKQPPNVKPDRVFATSGHGEKGSITEYRYGLKAAIGLDVDYKTEVKQAWLLPWRNGLGEKGYHVLLSMPDSSAVLSFPEDLSSVQEDEAENLPYDFSSPTLAVSYSKDFIVQVTAEFVVLIRLDNSTQARYGIAEVLKFTTNVVASDACIQGGYMAMSTHIGSQYFVYTLKLDVEHLSVTRVREITVSGDVTCLAMGAANTVLFGIWDNGRPILWRGALEPAAYTDGPEQVFDWDLNLCFEHVNPTTPIKFEAISSIVSAWNSIFVGTRSGEVIKLSDVKEAEYEKYGFTTVKITSGCSLSGAGPTLLITCDKNLVLLRNNGTESALFHSTRSRDKLRVWPFDESNPSAMSPPVDYGITVDIPCGSSDITPILMVSGTKLLFAEVNEQPGPVHRHMPVNGTPTKVIYSHHLQCLVAAVNKGDKPTLMFVNPDTGEDLGRPIDKKKDCPLDFIPGLGKSGDRIFGLTEWEFKKDGNIWRYILVATRDGRMIVVSTGRGEAREDGPPTIRYWTQFQRKGYDRPVYSVVGYDEGLIYCVGQTIHWDVLDATERKLKEVKTFALGSPATSLRISNGKLMALTSRDSLEIIDHSPGEGESTGQSHVDPKTRNAIHMIEVAGTQNEEPLGGIVLVADRDCEVVGLWVPWHAPGRECEVIFEAELSTSIRRFRRGRTRPPWEYPQHCPQYGRLVSTLDDAEVLGMSLDGSLQHFTLLNLDSWRLLRFIQNIALTNAELYPFTHTHQLIDDYSDFDPEPRMTRGPEMQVDGDMLQRCLEKRALQRLLSWPAHEARFAELLAALDDGKHVAGRTMTESREELFDVAYDVLDYFLRPVL